MPITLSDTDISRVNVTYEANALPVCNLTVANKDGKYTSASAMVDEGMPIIISTSDNYRDFTRLFSGSIYQKESNLSPDGQSMLYLRCRDERLARVWVECNQGVVDREDVGGAFTGSATATDGSSWSADSQGNYPNGLLYDTGFTLSDPGGDAANYYTDSIDIPKIVFTHEPRFTALNRVADLFDLRWYINPSDQTFALYTGKTSYASTDYTASYGENINRSSLLADNLRSCSGVRVYGPAPYFFQTGSEPFHEIYDGGLISLTEAKEIGLRWYEKHTVSTKGGSIKAPTITNSVIGKNIQISDSARGWDSTGDIIGVRHDITPDRAMTELTVDNEKFTEPKTFAAVLDELEKMRQEENYTGKFDCFLHLQYGGDGVLGGGSASGYSPCAIGIGTSSDNVTITPQGLIDIIPITGKVDNTYYANWGARINPTLDFSADSVLIKEVIVFENQHGVVTDTSQVGYMWDRASTSGQWDGETKWHAELDTYSCAIDFVELTYDHFPVTQDDIKIASKDASYYMEALHPTGSVWGDKDLHVALSQSSIQDFSWDYLSKSSNYYAYTHSIAVGNDEWAGMRFSIDTGFTKYERMDADKLWMNVVARVSGSAINDATISDFTIHLCDLLGTTASFGPGGWSAQYCTVSGWNYITAVFNLTHSGYSFFDEGGRIYPLLLPETGSAGVVAKCKANTDVVFEIAYVEHGVERGKPSTIRFTEKAEFIDDGQSIKLQYPIREVLGFYSTSDKTGEELSWKYPTEYAYMYPDRHMHILGEYRWYWNAHWWAERGNVLDSTMGGRWGSVNFRDIMEVFQIDDLYIDYVVNWQKPTMIEKIPKDDKLFLLQRGATGSRDHIVWAHPTSTDHAMPGHIKPLYGELYHVHYNGVFDPSHIRARWTSSVGLDKTLDKTLTVAWQDS